MFGIQSWVAGIGLSAGATFVVTKALLVTGVVLLSVIGYLIAKNILISVIRKIVTRTKAHGTTSSSARCFSNILSVDNTVTSRPS
jgi:hypothetical protein